MKHALTAAAPALMTALPAAAHGTGAHDHGAGGLGAALFAMAVAGALMVLSRRRTARARA